VFLPPPRGAQLVAFLPQRFQVGVGQGRNERGAGGAAGEDVSSHSSVVIGQKQKEIFAAKGRKDPKEIFAFLCVLSWLFPPP
jgi:hypothetical protein